MNTKESMFYRLYTSLCGASNSLGKWREKKVLELLLEDNKYKIIKREVKVEITAEERTHHSVDLWLEDDNNIYLANLKSAGHSNTEALDGMLRTFTDTVNRIQKENPNKKVSYIILRYNKAKHAKTQKKLVETLLKHNIESYDLEEFLGVDVTSASNDEFKRRAEKNLTERLAKEELLALGQWLIELANKL